MPKEDQTNEPSGEITPALKPMQGHQEKPLTPKPEDKKKKKKKNKGKKKRPSNLPAKAPLSSSNQEAEEPLIPVDTSATEQLTTPQESIQTVITLPVKPDEWFIKPATYDDSDNLLTEETFTFLQNGIEIINLPFNETNFQALTILLNERFDLKTSDTQADYFHVRKPLLDSEESNPIMTLTQKSAILATTELDQKTLKRLIRALQQHVQHTSPVTAWLNRWWHKHKIARVFLCIAAVPLALILLYTLFWGATN